MIQIHFQQKLELTFLDLDVIMHRMSDKTKE